MIGLIGNEFITIYTPGRGVFDWNDIVWTIIGGIVLFSTYNNSKLRINGC